MFIALRPGKNRDKLIPMCGDCNGRYRQRTDLVLTTFENRITRWLCPKCGKKQYTEGMSAQIRGYSIYIEIEGDSNERD